MAKPKRGEAEYRVVWARSTWRAPKSKLFQVLESAEAYAWFLKSTEGRRIRKDAYDPGSDPMEPLSMIRIDYRQTGKWRDPEWDGWTAPRVPKPGYIEPEQEGSRHTAPTEGADVQIEEP